MRWFNGDFQSYTHHSQIVSERKNATYEEIKYRVVNETWVIVDRAQERKNHYMLHYAQE